MAELQHAPRRASLPAVGIVPLIAAMVIAVVIIFGMLISGRVSLPTLDAGPVLVEPNPALVQAEREWQRQREQQGGFVNPLTQVEREWERQRQQQTP